MAPNTRQPPPVIPIHDRYHRLLTTRYVCQNCLTRYFTRYPWCRACRRRNCIVPLDPSLPDRAKSDTQLRALISRDSSN